MNTLLILLLLCFIGMICFVGIVGIFYALSGPGIKESEENIAKLYEQEKKEILENPKPHWLYNTLEEAQAADLEELKHSQELFANRPKTSLFSLN